MNKTNKYIILLEKLTSKKVFFKEGNEAYNFLKDTDFKKLTFEIKNEGMFNAAYFNLPLIDNKEIALRFRNKQYPDINNGDAIMELHIDIPPDYQKLGLAQKMIKSFLYREGGTFWISYGRICNSNVYKVIEKLKIDPNLLVEEYENGITIEEK